MEDLRTEISIRAPVEQIWSAWTSSKLITSWFAPKASIDPRPGGYFELYFDPANLDHECTKGCVFTTVEPKKRLGFTWKGPDQFARLMNDPSKLTSVLVIFHDEDGTTRIVLEHTGWGEGEEWAEARSWHERAWKEALGSLKSELEHHAGI